MNKQLIVYCTIALAVTVSSVAFGLYHKDDALRESRRNGTLYFQNSILERQVKELEQKLETCKER